MPQPVPFSWRVDETLVQVKGRWKHLYRAIDKQSATLDFFLADRRGAEEALGRLGAALRRPRDRIPRVIDTGKNPAHGQAIADLKEEGVIPPELKHWQSKYLNNRLESDHGKLERLIRPTLGFQPMRTARATIKRFEVVQMFKEGQFRSWVEALGGGTEAAFIKRLFGVHA